MCRQTNISSFNSLMNIRPDSKANFSFHVKGNLTRLDSLHLGQIWYETTAFWLETYCNEGGFNEDFYIMLEEKKIKERNPTHILKQLLNGQKYRRAVVYINEFNSDKIKSVKFEDCTSIFFSFYDKSISVKISEQVTPSQWAIDSIDQLENTFLQHFINRNYPKAILSR